MIVTCSRARPACGFACGGHQYWGIDQECEHARPLFLLRARVRMHLLPPAANIDLPTTGGALSRLKSDPRAQCRSGMPSEHPHTCRYFQTDGNAVTGRVSGEIQLQGQFYDNYSLGTARKAVGPPPSTRSTCYLPTAAKRRMALFTVRATTRLSGYDTQRRLLSRRRDIYVIDKAIMVTIVYCVLLADNRQQQRVRYHCRRHRQRLRRLC